MTSQNKNSAQKKDQIKTDRDLVAEQPGKFVVVSGLLLAFLLGYTVSAYLSPARVTSYIREASSRIHRDVQVEFASAEISFSNGVLPRLSVLIHNVKMQSSQKCWGQPVLEADELILPLSIRGLWRGRAPIPQIYANQIKLHFRGEFKSCDSSQNRGNTVSSNLVNMQPSSRTQDSSPADVNGLYIGKLSISADAMPALQTEILNFQATLKSSNPRIIEVTAKTHLLKDNQVGDYLSHANIFLEYRDSPTQRLQTHFFGNWREGHYSLIANYSFDDRRVALESDLRHIPLSQVLDLLKKYRVLTADLDARQIWISAQAQLQSSIDDLRKSPLQVQNFKLEGELGDIQVDQFQLKSLDPVQYEPLQVSIRNLRVESLMALLRRPAKSPILGDLGQFSGRATINSADRMVLTGEHSGLEFVFSNKGQREVQSFTRIVGDVWLQDDRWNFKVQRADPQDGTLVGNLVVRADRDFKDVTVVAKVEEFSLAPKVQKLMTSGGDIGPLSFDADLNIQEGSIRSLKGLLQLSQVNVEGLFLLKNKFQFKLVPDGLAFQYSNTSMLVDPESPAMKVIEGAAQAVGLDSKKVLRVDHFLGDFKLNRDQQFSWAQARGRLNTQAHFVTNGSWNHGGQIQGLLRIKEGPHEERWSLQGTRDVPLLKPEAD